MALKERYRVAFSDSDGGFSRLAYAKLNAMLRTRLVDNKSPLGHFAEERGLQSDIARATIPEAVASLRRADADVALVPAFNSICGPENATFEELARGDLQIVAEIDLKTEHALVAVRRAFHVVGVYDFQKEKEPADMMAESDRKADEAAALHDAADDDDLNAKAARRTGDAKAADAQQRRLTLNELAERRDAQVTRTAAWFAGWLGRRLVKEDDIAALRAEVDTLEKAALSAKQKSADLTAAANDKRARAKTLVEEAQQLRNQARPKLLALGGDKSRASVEFVKHLRDLYGSERSLRQCEGALLTEGLPRRDHHRHQHDAPRMVSRLLECYSAPSYSASVAQRLGNAVAQGPAAYQQQQPFGPPPAGGFSPIGVGGITAPPQAAAGFGTAESGVCNLVEMPNPFIAGLAPKGLYADGVTRFRAHRLAPLDLAEDLIELSHPTLAHLDALGNSTRFLLLGRADDPCATSLRKALSESVKRQPPPDLPKASSLCVTEPGATPEFVVRHKFMLSAPLLLALKEKEKARSIYSETAWISVLARLIKILDPKDTKLPEHSFLTPIRVEAAGQVIGLFEAVCFYPPGKLAAFGKEHDEISKVLKAKKPTFFGGEVEDPERKAPEKTKLLGFYPAFSETGVDYIKPPSEKDEVKRADFWDFVTKGVGQAALAVFFIALYFALLFTFMETFRSYNSGTSNQQQVQPDTPPKPGAPTQDTAPPTDPDQPPPATPIGPDEHSTAPPDTQVPQTPAPQTPTPQVPAQGSSSNPVPPATAKELVELSTVPVPKPLTSVAEMDLPPCPATCPAGRCAYRVADTGFTPVCMPPELKCPAVCPPRNGREAATDRCILTTDAGGNQITRCLYPCRASDARCIAALSARDVRGRLFALLADR